MVPAITGTFYTLINGASCFEQYLYIPQKHFSSFPAFVCTRIQPNRSHTPLNKTKRFGQPNKEVRETSCLYIHNVTEYEVGTEEEDRKKTCGDEVVPTKQGSDHFKHWPYVIENGDWPCEVTARAQSRDSYLQKENTHEDASDKTAQERSVHLEDWSFVKEDVN